MRWKSVWKALLKFEPFRSDIIFNRHNKYLNHLAYAGKRLKNPMYSDLCEEDLEYKVEAVTWLTMYYEGHPHAVSEGPPEDKLESILSKPTRDVTQRDHVFVRVLYHWCKNHRVMGF